MVFSCISQEETFNDEYIWSVQMWSCLLDTIIIVKNKWRPMAFLLIMSMPLFRYLSDNNVAFQADSMSWFSEGN